MVHRWRYNYLRLGVVAVAVAILYVLVVDAVWQLRRSAEASAVRTLVWQLRSALAVEAAKRAGRQDWQGIEGLIGVNPMLLLDQHPDNYIGEFAKETDGTADRGELAGTWRFDSSSKALVYRPQFLEIAENELSFQVTLFFADNVDKDQLEADPSGSRIVKRVSLMSTNTGTLGL